MKKIIAVSILLLSLGQGASAQGISFFHGSFEEAKAEAAKQHKLIFIDCFTTWCGPCNRMARDVFPKPEVGDFYNAHFICCKIDMEKGEGLRIAKDFGVRAYPTYLFLDASGSLEHRTLGSKEPDVFINDGKTAIDPEKNLHGLTERFNRGETDTAMLHALMDVSSYADHDLCEKALGAYWKAVPPYHFIEQQNWDIFSSYETDFDSKAFQYIVSHKDNFEKKYGADAVNNTLYGKAAADIRYAADTKNKDLFTRATDFLKTCKDRQTNETAGMNTLRYYRKAGDWKEYLRVSRLLMDAYGNNQEIYNSVAWEMVSNSNDPEVLNQALDFINKSMAFDKNYGNSDTWANVLYKLKRYKEAETAANESIELAKKEKLDYTSTKELLNKIENALSTQQ